MKFKDFPLIKLLACDLWLNQRHPQAQELKQFDEALERIERDHLYWVYRQEDTPFTIDLRLVEDQLKGLTPKEREDLASIDESVNDEVAKRVPEANRAADFLAAELAPKAKPSKAHVVASVWSKKEHRLVHTDESIMSTDLPAESLGELAASALEATWKMGCDPIDITLIFNFR